MKVAMKLIKNSLAEECVCDRMSLIQLGFPNIELIERFFFVLRFDLVNIYLRMYSLKHFSMFMKMTTLKVWPFTGDHWLTRINYLKIKWIGFFSSILHNFSSRIFLKMFRFIFLFSSKLCFSCVFCAVFFFTNRI